MPGQGGRRAAARGAAMLLVAATVLVGAAASANASPATCTFDTNADLVTGVSPGATIAVACTGLGAGQSISITELSPLAMIVQPTSSAAFESSSASPIVVVADAFGDGATTFTLPAPFSAADPSATCPPTQAQVNAGLVSCQLAITDTTTTAPIASARLIYTGQPTPQVTPTVNVTNGVSFVAGDVVTFAGSGFWGSPLASSPAVFFGATSAAVLPASPITIAASTYTCAPDCNGTAGVLSSGGTVTGSVVVPPGLSAGPTAVSVLQANVSGLPGNGLLDSVSAASAVTMLGAPSAAATPNNGGPGTPVQITGTGWDPQGPAPTLAFLTPSTPGGTPSSATGLVDANGNLSAVITVTGADLLGANPVVVTQGGLTAQASYTVTDITATCVGSSCTTNQVLTQQIGAGDLSLSEQSSSVSLTAITLNGIAQHSTGQINAIDVVDDRGILVGWTVTGTLSGDFVNQTPIGTSANNTIPASNLGWTPAVGLTAPGSGDLTQVTAGTSAQLSKTAGATLCAALTGGGGGSYRCTASLDLTVPASIAAGTYTVVLNITIT